jgi:16S rRNA (adenine(1408)-N(1))-methyltransferase
VHFPWGSLLRGILGHDAVVLAGVAQLLAPGAAATALVSVVARDSVPALPSPAELASAYARHGLCLTDARPATPAEVAASHSSWAKRLRAGTARPVTLLRLRAACNEPPSPSWRDDCGQDRQEAIQHRAERAQAALGTGG